jgi:hypothetical protein
VLNSPNLVFVRDFFVLCQPEVLARSDFVYDGDVTPMDAASHAITERGYVVSSFNLPLAPGTRVMRLWDSPLASFGTLDVPFVVICETNLEDLKEQRLLLGIDPAKEHYGYFYRLMTD